MRIILNKKTSCTMREVFCYTKDMTNNSYPQTLSNSIRDLVENEGYIINDVLQSFQFLFSEAKLSQMITWKMRNDVLDLLQNNGAPKEL